MSTFGIIFWSSLAIVIIISIVFIKRYQRKNLLEHQEEVKKRRKINEGLGKQADGYNERYTVVYNALKGVVDPKVFEPFRKLLNDYYRTNFADSYQVLPKLTKELIVLHELYANYRNKLLRQQRLLEDFEIAKRTLEQQLFIVRKLNLSEEMRGKVSNLENRLLVDIKNFNAKPNRDSISRTTRSSKQLDSIFLASPVRWGFFLLTFSL